jgi:hypothetical protein
MSRNAHHLGDTLHFGELPAGRVVTEDMTTFSAGTPVEDVLTWISDRLADTETGKHRVGFFSLSAVTLIPSFTIDAVIHKPDRQYSFTIDARFPGSAVNGGVFRLDAVIMPSFTIDAWLKRPGPDGVIHEDHFTNQILNSWGYPDTGIGWKYTYTNAAHETASDKFEITQDVTDPDFPDYRGLYLEQDQTFYRTSINDVGYYDKHVKVTITPGRYSGTGGNYQYQYRFGRGETTYVAFSAAGNATLGPDRLIVVINGVQLTNQPLGDTGGVVNTYRQSSPVVTEFYVLGNHIKARIYTEGTTPPSWNDPWQSFQWFGTFPAASGTTSIDWNGSDTSTFKTWGAPWLHYVHEWTVTALGAGRITMDAFIKPFLTIDAVLIKGGTFKIDAFVQPTFRIDAYIVIEQTGSFTIDSVIPLTTTKTFSIDAFTKPFFTIDAQIFAPTVSSFPMDAAFVYTHSGTITLNAVIRDTDRSYTFTINATKEILGTPQTFTLDAAKNSGGTFTLDAVLDPGSFHVYAIKKEFGLSGAFTIDAYYYDRRLQRSFYIDCYIVIEQTGSFTLDAWKKTAPDEWAHWDDFDNRITTSGLGIPSKSGHYSYQANEFRHTVANGRWRYVDYMTDDRVYLDDTDANLDREVYFEVDPELNVGASIGDWYYYITTNLRLRNHLNGAFYYIQYNGVDTAFYLTPGTTSWVACRFAIYNHGKNIKWKIWNRASSEPALWMQWIDASAQGWTLTTGRVSFDAQSDSWFGQGDPPFDHYLDNVKVRLDTGYPYSFTTDASLRKFDITSTFKAEAIKIPPPFTIDAFVQPYFWMNARIWLGTTFTMDAVIQQPDNIHGGYEYVPSGNVADTTYWSHVSVRAVGADYVYLVDGESSGSGAVWSKESFGPSAGNAFPSQLDSVYGRKLIASLKEVPRDALAFGVRSASLGYSDNAMTGLYGFQLRDFDNVVRDVINGSEGSQSSWTGTAPEWTEFSIEYIDIGGGSSQMKLYNQNGSLLRTSASFTTPTWTAFRFGFRGATGIVGGYHGVQGTPRFYSPHERDGAWVDAWIASGGNFNIGAWIRRPSQPVILDAILKATLESAFMMDAASFDFGTQLRDFTIDALSIRGGIFRIDARIWGNTTFTMDAVIYDADASTRDAIMDYENDWHPRARVYEDGAGATPALITIDRYERNT